VDFPLDTPFIYQGTSLVLDFEVLGSATNHAHKPWSIDAFIGREAALPNVPKDPYGRKRKTVRVQRDYGFISRTGPACPDGKGQRFALHGFYLHRNSPGFFFGKSYCSGTKTGVCLLGKGYGSFMGTPLPIDLGQVGAPGCLLGTDIRAYLVSRTDPNSGDGLISFQFQRLSNHPDLIGGYITVQAVVMDQSYNNLGVRVSDVLECWVGSGMTGKIDAYSFYSYYTPLQQSQQEFAHWQLSTEPYGRDGKRDPYVGESCTYASKIVPILGVY